MTWAAVKIPVKKSRMPSRPLASNFLKKTGEARAYGFGSQGSADRQYAAGVEFIDENGGGPGVSENPSGLNDPNKVQGTRLPQKARGSALSPIASPQQRLTAEQNRERAFAAGLTIGDQQAQVPQLLGHAARLIAASAALRRSGRYRASMIPLRCRNRCRSKTKFKRAVGPQATLHDQMKQTGP